MRIIRIILTTLLPVAVLGAFISFTALIGVLVDHFGLDIIILPDTDQPLLLKHLADGSSVIAIAIFIAFILVGLHGLGQIMIEGFSRSEEKGSGDDH